MREGLAVLEKLHFIYQAVKEECILGGDEVLDYAGRRVHGCRLADGGHIIKAEIVEFGNIELVEFV